MNKIITMITIVATLLATNIPAKAINEEWSAVAGFVGGLLVANVANNHNHYEPPTRVVYRERVVHQPVYREHIVHHYNNLPHYQPVHVSRNDTPRFNHHYQPRPRVNHNFNYNYNYNYSPRPNRGAGCY